MFTSRKSISGATLAIGLAIGMAALAVPALAHHSFAAYDMSATRQVSGTLREFRWGAPHSSMVIEITDSRNRTTTRMSLTSGSPLSFSRQGFNPRDFRRGEAVRVTYHPNVNGSPGGALATLRLASGRTYSDEEAARAGPPGR